MRGSTTRAAELAARIESELRLLADPERATHERQYLKSDLEFIGVSVPAMRRVARGVLRTELELDRKLLLELVDRLWISEVHELRAAAVEALRARAKLLESGDLAVVERLIREAGTWALVDPLAVDVAGGMLERFPDLAAEIKRWSSDPDFWVRRSVLLAHLGTLRRGGGDFEQFSGYADAMLEEREFFIRKAIGWVLRETAKRRPELVADWVAARTHRASGVTMREATRHLSEGERERLMSAYRERRPARSGWR